MSTSTCSRCGTPRNPAEATDVCPTCVLTALTGPAPSIHGAFEHAGPDPSPEVDSRLEPGDQLGPYRIERLLGRGGMGEVYEAAHVDHGRHVALKVLTRPLRRPQDRERFLAEGRMAAAFNHPNSVYVFETRDVGGLPTIAMELLSGETLQDCVRRNGPMPPREAVDAMLQVIAGLDAALNAGVLHRDVKPANCLLDRDGIVKIGDFGLSISPGLGGSLPSFAGTPQFAAPEQLRGEPLDHRADIYAVGATLWYLLAGQPPFDADDYNRLLDRIASQTTGVAETYEEWPKGLREVVIRCLAASREARYQSYAELRAALLPYATPDSQPERLAYRVANATLNLMVAVPLTALIVGSLIGWPGAQERTAAVLGALIVLGGYWGALTDASGAPWLARTQRSTVRRFDATHAGFRAVLRLLVFVGPILVGAFATAVVMRYPHAPRGMGPAMVIGLLTLGYVGIVGRAGSHRRLLDLLSARPVAAPLARAIRRGVTETARPREIGQHVERLGPFEITGCLINGASYDVLTTWDPQLERPVWIHRQSPGASPVSQAARRASRISRLRWLQGSRTPSEAWDAYEAPDGHALLAADAPAAWSEVSIWLSDLAQELVARNREEPVERIPGLDHVWITGNGRGVLLQFPAPVPSGLVDAGEQSPPSAQQWLYAAATRAMSGSMAALPLTASQSLRRLKQDGFTSLDAVADALLPLRDVPNVVDRQTRWMTLALSGLVAQLMSDLVGGVTSDVLTSVAPRIVAHGLMTPLTTGWLVCAGLAVVSAALMRGGFWLSALSLAVVTPDGREASRWRAAVRAAVAWSWVPVTAIVRAAGGPVFWVLGGALALAALPVAIPRRSLQDLVTGTYLVPR